MNLKEAFRYQNKLQALMDEAQSILGCDANITKVESTHLRRKVMPEAEDETVCAMPETEYYEQITQIAQFLSAHERSAQLGADHCQRRHRLSL